MVLFMATQCSEHEHTVTLLLQDVLPLGTGPLNTSLSELLSDPKLEVSQTSSLCPPCMSGTARY